MTSQEQPIVIELTEEQQRLIYRMSGQHAKVLELTPDASDASVGSGRALQFHWRQSIATGIPRQVWGTASQQRPPAAEDDAK